jgi:hypothetical protein
MVNLYFIFFIMQDEKIVTDNKTLQHEFISCVHTFLMVSHNISYFQLSVFHLYTVYISDDVT